MWPSGSSIPVVDGPEVFKASGRDKERLFQNHRLLSDYGHRTLGYALSKKLTKWMRGRKILRQGTGVAFRTTLNPNPIQMAHHEGPKHRLMGVIVGALSPCSAWTPSNATGQPSLPPDGTEATMLNCPVTSTLGKSATAPGDWELAPRGQAKIPTTGVHPSHHEARFTGGHHPIQSPSAALVDLVWRSRPCHSQTQRGDDLVHGADSAQHRCDGHRTETECGWADGDPR